jgi:hypothetical protein
MSGRPRTLDDWHRDDQVASVTGRSILSKSHRTSVTSNGSGKPNRPRPLTHKWAHPKVAGSNVAALGRVLGPGQRED